MHARMCGHQRIHAHLDHPCICLSVFTRIHNCHSYIFVCHCHGCKVMHVCSCMWTWTWGISLHCHGCEAMHIRIFIYNLRHSHFCEARYVHACLLGRHSFVQGKHACIGACVPQQVVCRACAAGLKMLRQPSWADIWVVFLCDAGASAREGSAGKQRPCVCVCVALGIHKPLV